MSRPEPGGPAGRGRSMAGSLAINIYSASRVAEESTRLEPVQAERRKKKSQHTHAQTLAEGLSAPFFPPSAITAQADRLDPPSVVLDLTASSAEKMQL